MRVRLVGSVAILLGAVLGSGAVSSPAQSRDVTIEAMRSEKRVALVVGNAAYPTSPLRNPVNDARAMAQLLGDLGFDVILRVNITENQMKRAIDEFGDRLLGGGVGLFFYAGHGIQLGGRNYLIPVDARIHGERDVDVESVDVNRVLARMEGARNRLNILVLDACRNNPFARSFRSASPGLVSIDAPSGTLIAYATAPGRLARDSEDTHSPNGLYTAELLRAMREPGLRLEDVFKRVRSAVRSRSNGEQVPWEASSVEGEFMFALPRIASPGPSSSSPNLGVETQVHQGSSWLAVSPRPPAVARREQFLVLSPDQRSDERTAEIVAPGYGFHRYKVFFIDVTAFERGGLYIDIEIDKDSRTDGSFDLFLQGTPIPTRGAGPPGSVAGAHDIGKGRTTRIAYEITRGQVFSFGVEGNWFSQEGSNGVIRFRARVETP